MMDGRGSIYMSNLKIGGSHKSFTMKYSKMLYIEKCRDHKRN